MTPPEHFLAVLGVVLFFGLLLPQLLRPLHLPFAELSVVYTIPILLFASLALLHFVRSDWRVSRAQGVLAVVGYAAFLVLAFLQGWG